MKIEIITTSNENLKETGFGTIEACRAVLKSLQKKHKNVRLNICENEADLAEVVMRQPDLVFLAVKYIQPKNEKIWLSDFFEKSNINFTGSKREILKFGSNKQEAKKLVASEGVRIADYFVVTPTTYQLEDELPISFPLFLKPMDAANGNGIDDESLVYNFTDYNKKVESIFLKYDKMVLAEEYLSGREFTIAVIENVIDNELLISAIEIIPPKNKNGIRILGERVKKEDSEELKEITDNRIKNELEKISKDIFRILSASDYARIDIKMDEQGLCYFMEVNLVPGMKKGSSYFPKAFEIEKKFSYDTVIELILNNALKRCQLPTTLKGSGL